MQLYRSSKFTSIIIRFSLAGLIIIMTLTYALAGSEPQKSEKSLNPMIPMTEFEFRQRVLEMDAKTKSINLQKKSWQPHTSVLHYPEGFIIQWLYVTPKKTDKPGQGLGLNFLNRKKNP